MKDLYSKLFSDCNTVYRYNKESIGLDSLSHFVSMKGPEYDNQPVRLFVIGRAVNGWLQLPCSSADVFSKNANRLFNSTGFTWVVDDESGLHNTPEDNESIYYLSGSPFWRVSHRIWQGLSEFDCIRWVDNIAWSNLYKIAPAKTGNPTTTMCKKQFTACRAILRHEIESYKPTHILFITGWRGWFSDETCDFSTLFTHCQHIGNNSDDPQIYVEGISEYVFPSGRTIPAIVTCRPEFRNEDNFVDQALAYLR